MPANVTPVPFRDRSRTARAAAGATQAEIFRQAFLVAVLVAVAAVGAPL